jgi:hypothetical protein
MNIHKISGWSLVETPTLLAASRIPIEGLM